MLDDIEKAAAALLEISASEVQQIREALLAEVATDEGRYACRTALKHPEGSATTLNDAADRAQQSYAKVRAKAMNQLPALIALILAERVARQKRDEAAVARDRHWAAEYERRATGQHPETRDLFARLFEHGVTPWHLKALRDEEVAIIADLIRWKANDAKYRDALSPWREVLQVYAGRLVLQADYGVRVKRSTPGTPVRGKKYSSPKYYMFNEMVHAEWSPWAVARSEPSDTIVAIVRDPVPATAAPVPAVDTAERDSDAVMDDAAAEAGDVVGLPDEYALPATVSAADAACLLAGARRWIELDQDWPFELRYAIGWSERSDAETIAAVEAAVTPPADTAFRYFTEAAREGGIEAGHQAYREATIRRFAFEFATMASWQDMRARLGLNW